MFDQLSTSRTQKPCFTGLYASLCFTDRIYGGTIQGESARIYSLTHREIDVVSAYDNVSRGRNRPAAHKGYPGNAVPLATRPEMERACTGLQGTRVTFLGYQEGERATALSKNYRRSKRMNLVIKVSEARPILAMGDSLGAPFVKTNREGNMIYYTADPDEMDLWRRSQSSGEVNDRT